jgi:hypothetical protein
MKAYILTEKDFETLLLKLDRNPLYGQDGGSSVASVRDLEQQKLYDEAHRFYNYQIRTWIDNVKE